MWSPVHSVLSCAAGEGDQNIYVLGIKWKSQINNRKIVETQIYDSGSVQLLNDHYKFSDIFLLDFKDN